MDKVSVIIPNYNHARFLKKRIESVLMQSVKPAEIIILDDCSTDGSQDMINQYRDHTLVSHILINDKNSGSPFKQWQKGILYATGDWIWIAESDDYAEQNFLKEMLSLADKYQQAGLLYCDSAIVEGDKVQAESFA
ncbi:MAG: glycosyltransferase family 2 protein, partial [Cyclobacteriaceae bacterium]|nr:glycosyltransferase family 2 protein [Cyclobacteriaceae bacterium]